MEEARYRETLDKVIRHAHEHHNYITEEAYRGFFDPILMNEREDELTRNYLSGINIRFGVWDGKDEWPEFGEEDGKYLKLYLEELEALPRYSEEEINRAKREAVFDDSEEARRILMDHYLKNVVDIARLYMYQAVPAEDLIGEGNIALMTAISGLSVLEGADDVDGFIGGLIMDAMDKAIYEDTRARESADDTLRRINEINDKAREMSEEEMRSVTVRELSEASGISEDEIREAMRLTGNKIEGLIP